MPRRNRNVWKGGNHHRRASGKKGARADKAPLTPGEMHSRTRLRRANG